MRLSLHSKLYLITLCLSLCLGVGIYWLTQHNLKSGLLERATQTTLEQLDQLAENTIKHYQQEGGWQHLQRHPNAWKRMRRGDNLSTTERRPPPRRHRDDFFSGHDRSERRPPPKRERPPEHSKKRAPLDGGVTVALLNKDKKIIAGHFNPRTKLATRALISAGETIGYLAIATPKQLTDALDVEFERQQREDFIPIVIAICAALILISLPLARRFTRPIIELQQQARRLTEGDFNTRNQQHSSDELGDLGRDFNTLAKTLDNNEKMRRQWVADISHELRTPIAVIKGHIEAIQDGVRPSGPDSWNKLHQKTEQLSRLVNDLHQLSLSDSGNLNYYKSEWRVKEFLQDIADTFTTQVKQSEKTLSIDLALDKSIAIYADQGRITQLLSNLLENSMKYTDAGGNIVISALQRAKTIRISIEDSSPGVNDSDMKKLFERLYRVDSSRNRSSGGAGLGLSLCQSIATAHGGQIKASHSSLGGLKVTLLLPIHNA